MNCFFSQKTYAKLRELNRFIGSANCDADGINMLWLNPDFSELNRNTSNIKMHSHTFYEVHFVLSGTVTYTDSNDQIFAVGENEFIFIPPCVRHKIESKSDSYKKLGLAFLYQPDGGENYIFSDRIYKGSGGAWMDQLFSLLSAGLELGNGTESRMFQNILSILVMFLTEQRVTAETEKNHVAPDERFIRAKSFIEDNSARDISVEEVSAYIYLSSKHLGRLFKENCNMTVAEFIAQSRCERAKKLLEDNKISISEIVNSLCFSNEQNFNRFFKRVTGITPGAYRELKGRMVADVIN